MITFRWNNAKYKTGPETTERSKKKEFLAFFVHLLASYDRKMFSQLLIRVTQGRFPPKYSENTFWGYPKFF